ncbi:MAG: ABC transporter ATP-binding protein [Firmicutes bacterium]|nr:ABC transporter ATP-binding protein [Bacillota bacterium]
MALSVDVQGITKVFGSFRAVSDVSFQIPAGSIFGFLGPNGAGKSTTIRMLLGIIQPTEGDGTVLGYDIIRESEKIKMNVGYMSQKFSLYEDLTVYENLDFFCGIFELTGKAKKDRIDFLISLTKLDGYEDKLTYNLPQGVRQRLALATALINDPKLVFLDEPTGGVDPALRRYFWDIIADLSKQGRTVMVTSHYMDEVERCDNICFIYGGKLIAKGTPSQLKANYIQGEIYSFETENRLNALSALQELSWVKNPFPAGRAVRFLVDKGGFREDEMKQHLAAVSVKDVNIRKTSPTLEDVFISLVINTRS